MGWAQDDAVDVGCLIAAFGDESFGRAPAGGQQGGGVAALDFADE